jgi:hypothetical protein
LPLAFAEAFVMRTFVRVRALATTHSDLAKRLAELEDKTEALAMSHDTISMFTAMARGLPSTEDSIATPCSVKA